MSNALPQGFRQVGENRVREVVGLGLDELTVGLVIEHRPARTVTEAEHVQVLALMGNEAPAHSDIEFCQRADRDQVLVCGILTLNIVLGMTIRSTSDSRRDQGIVTCRIEGHNQYNRRVLSCSRTFFVPADPGALRDATGY
ncbi:MAG: hypothetical protein ACRDRR_22010 [Pseudonocardiaceae bacterium]